MPTRTPAVCPFFVREKRLEICCEGMENGAYTGVCFPMEENRRRWFAAYCGSFQYERCPYARMIGGKYEQDTGKTAAEG